MSDMYGTLETAVLLLNKYLYQRAINGNNFESKPNINIFYWKFRAKEKIFKIYYIKNDIPHTNK